MSECHGDTCITCGDVAVEVTVLRLLPEAMAVVDVGHGEEAGHGEEEVSVALVDAVPGDTILVHASEALAVVAHDDRPRAHDREATA
ncbi:MAG TPA: hydrogenase assembly protein HupF [Trebonia sp.]|jgi:hydrogenase expression/formation protein HypC|nr:hydrogenase assembly protein HupF [Trebonia sp.]